MKILQFGRYFPPHIGGTENVMLDITKGMVEQGFNCDVLCTNDLFKFQLDIYANYKVYRSSNLFTYGSISISPQQIFIFRKLVKSYDIIHIHHPAPMATICLLLANISNVKIIVTWHSDIVRQKLLLKIYRPLQNWLLGKAIKIVATSPIYVQNSEALKKFHNKTVYIPLGIDKLPDTDEKKVGLLRSKYGRKKIVFSLGRLVEYKGFEYLIESSSYLNDEYIILIGGDGPLKSMLENKIKEMGLEKRVVLLGKIDQRDLISYYDLCDIFCLSSISKNEAFGIVILEAMSRKKPIIATNIPGSGVSWVNKDGVSGINVGIKSAEDIAKAIMKISGDEMLKDRFSLGAYNRYLELFTKQKMTESYINLYSKL